MALTLQNVRDMVREGTGQKEGGPRAGTFRILRNAQRKDQRFYDLKYEIKIHEIFKKIKLPTARQMVDTFVSHLPLTKPVVEVIPFADKDPYKTRAITQQDYYTWLLTWYMQQLENILQKSSKDLGIRGEAFIKMVWDENAIGTTAEGKEKEGDERDMALLERMPLRMMCPDPMNCFPHTDHIDCHPADMIEIYYLQAEQVRRIWPDWDKRNSFANTTKVKLAELWTPSQVCFLANNDPLLGEGKEKDIIDNPYKIVPYTHVYSGYGHPDEDNTPESKAVSIIRYAEEIIEQQCRYHSYLDKAAAFAAMPIVELPGSREDYAEGGKKLVPHPGMITFRGETEGEGARVVWAAPNLPAGILQAIGVTDALLGKEQPGVVRGEAPKGIEAGYPMALMIGEARLQFGLPLQNLQTLFSRALEQARFLIKDVAKETVSVWGEDKVIKISPEDCEGAYRVKVEFDASTPERRAQRALAGQKLRQGGSISRYTELKEYQNNKNPKKEINRMYAESLMTHPALQTMAAVNAVRALEGEKAAMAIQMAMAEGAAGAGRKARSAGKAGTEEEAQLPEDVLAQAIGSKRGQAIRAETEAE